MIVRADESEAQDGRINTDADAGSSALESTGRTTSRGDEEKTGAGYRKWRGEWAGGGGRRAGNKTTTAWHRNMKIGDGWWW